ncbi:MAG TPA: Nramp family divalent metal transporter [Ktedonobacteraceae bacterium]|nr:Nramp family divalent metal transporter [Ktedonobacteraceae bacterium]
MRQENRASHLSEDQQKGIDLIEPGMIVEAEKGDLGEEDVSKPRVARVVRDDNGKIEKIVLQKGVFFKKEIDIPIDRILRVECGSDARDGKVVIDGGKKEIDSLSSVGKEQLASEREIGYSGDLLDTVEQNIPTAEGLREMEQGHVLPHPLKDKAEAQPRKSIGLIDWLRVVGPGFLSGMAGNDASAVATYAISGASFGFGQLWIILLSTPMYQALLYTCAKLGRVTQKGLADVLREHYGIWVAAFAAIVLIIANVALIAADLVAIGSGLELLTNVNWTWFVVPVALILWYLTVYRNFELLKKVFIVMRLAFAVYIVTALLARPDWGKVLFSTFVPHMNFKFSSISSTVALLGATFGPYSIFWQVQGEKEEKRPGSTRQQVRFAALDIAMGVVSGNLVAYFVIVSTAATLFTHHKSINTAADAAKALMPVLGPFAEYLFAIGLIGAGLVAIPVLLASTSYAVADTFGWPAGLSRKPWQSEGFYLILTVALGASMVVALAHLDPVKLLFWANVLCGILVPILMVFLLLIGNNRKIMCGQRLSMLTNFWLVLTILISVVATAFLFYGILTGQGG